MCGGVIVRVTRVQHPPLTPTKEAASLGEESAAMSEEVASSAISRRNWTAEELALGQQMPVDIPLVAVLNFSKEVAYCYALEPPDVLRSDTSLSAWAGQLENVVVERFIVDWKAGLAVANATQDRIDINHLPRCGLCASCGKEDRPVARPRCASGRVGRATPAALSLATVLQDPLRRFSGDRVIDVLTQDDAFRQALVDQLPGVKSVEAALQGDGEPRRRVGRRQKIGGIEPPKVRLGSVDPKALQPPELTASQHQVAHDAVAAIDCADDVYSTTWRAILGCRFDALLRA